VRSKVDGMAKRFRTEFEYSDPGITVALEKADCPAAFSAADSASLVDMICVLPDGFRRKSMKIEGLTTVSENLANIRTEEGMMTLRCFARSEVDSFLDQMAEEYRILSKLYGYTLELANRAPGWKFEQDSKIRETLFAAYKEINGFEMKMIAEHGGLETGYICGGIPGIDIVTCGPFCEGYHTPEERLDLASFRMIYEVLKRTLQNL
jgi:dipeptidase D